MADTNHPSWKTNPRCDEAQLAMLRRCSEAKDIREWNDWRKDKPNEEIWLQGVELEEANLKGAVLSCAHFEGANLDGAHLEGAKLYSATLIDAHAAYARLEGTGLDGATLLRTDLQGAVLKDAELRKAILDEAFLRDADLEGAVLNGASARGTEFLKADLAGAIFVDSQLQGARFHKTKMVGAKFGYAAVDGETLFAECTVDRDTDFTGVGLGACRIDPGLKQTLEYNVRRRRWHEWYAGGTKWKWAIRQLARLFWWTSDYGRSAGRIAAVFAVLSVLFAVAYRFLPTLVVCSDGKPIAGFWHAVYFSVVTMTTLGFGDIHASRGSALGQSLLMVQVILGYVLLGALVSRLAVLFQAGGPAAKFSKPARHNPKEAEGGPLVE